MDSLQPIASSPRSPPSAQRSSKILLPLETLYLDGFSWHFLAGLQKLPLGPHGNYIVLLVSKLFGVEFVTVQALLSSESIIRVGNLRAAWLPELAHANQTPYSRLSQPLET